MQRTVYWILILATISGCEIYSDALIRPEYQPSLILHAMLSLQEGGQAYIKYSEPIDNLRTQPAPALPEYSVILYENGAEKYVYTREEEGHYNLKTAPLLLFPDRDYHVEVKSIEGQLVL